MGTCRRLGLVGTVLLALVGVCALVLDQGQAIASVGGDPTHQMTLFQDFMHDAALAIVYFCH
jgi:hypothetical protein